jgi:FkbM family methyltransferase
MINFLKRKLAKHKLMTTRQEFGYELKSHNLDGYGLIEYAQWLNPFAYSMIAKDSQLRFLKQFISDGDFVIDIGANTGDTGLIMGLCAGPKGTVLALEPNPKSFKILKVNSSLNTDKLNIIPLQYAATKEDGEFYYNSEEATFNNGGISKNRDESFGKYELEEKIIGVNLENLLRKDYRHLLSSLSCIKVDTEGLDYEILSSLKAIIEEYKPAVIFEVFKKVKKEERYRLFDLFDQFGYDLYQHQAFDIDQTIKKLSRQDMTKQRYFDVYATYQHEN